MKFLTPSELVTQIDRKKESLKIEDAGVIQTKVDDHDGPYRHDRGRVYAPEAAGAPPRGLRAVLGLR